MEIFPILGLLILISSFSTQLLKIHHTHQVDGISPGAIFQVIACSLLFGGYYIGNSHFLALTLNIALLIVAALILVQYYKRIGK